MPARIVSQKKFSKLVSSTGTLSQPPGALTRLSNLLYTQRGSLQIADGSKSVAQNYPTPALLLALSSFANLKFGQFPYYPCLYLQSTADLADVTNFTASPVAGAGNSGGVYTFAIVATESIGSGTGHTDFRNSEAEFITIPTFSGVDFAWDAVSGAAAYDIYYFELSINPTLGIKIASAVTGTSYTFTGTLPALSGASDPLPYANTTYPLRLYLGSAQAGSLPILLEFASGEFPGILPYAAVTAPGSPSFNFTGTIPGFSPYGGQIGVTCPIPQIIQFAGVNILVLGNGYAPQEFDLAAASVTALTNTFTATYPTWQAGVAWTTGALVTDGAGNYYTATQGGVSETPGPPPWNTAQGDQTPDGSVLWTSNGPIASTTAPRGTAHAVAYAGSLWLANTSPTDTSDGLDGPSCLKMSDSNNPNSWNPVNIAFISRNDGTQITGLQPFTIAALGISPTGSLCVFKEFTTYQVIGVFGSTSFEIQPAQTNLGCIAPRSIQFLPGFGVCRFSHLGFAVFDGINDRLLSEDIRPYLFGGVDSEADLTPVDPSYVYRSVSAQTTQPPMYYCAMPLTGNSGSLTRLFCYDLVMKAWAVIDLPWAINSLAAMAVGEGYPLVLAGKSDGSIQRIQAGDVNWDQGDGGQAAVTWGFRSPDVFGEGASQRLFFEQVAIRGYGSAAMVQSIVANLWIDGQQVGAQAIDIVPQGGSNLFEARVKIFRNGYRAHLDVSGSNGNAAGVVDSLDWAVTPKSALARRVIS